MRVVIIKSKGVIALAFPWDLKLDAQFIFHQNWVSWAV